RVAGGGARVGRAADSPGYGPLSVTAWQRAHQKLTRQSGGWERWQDELPVIEGTLIRLTAAGRAAGYPQLEPAWLWASVPDAGEAEVTVLWQAWHRRFDLEHTFRFIKSQLGWTKPLLRRPAPPRPGTRPVTSCYAPP